MLAPPLTGVKNASPPPPISISDDHDHVINATSLTFKLKVYEGLQQNYLQIWRFLKDFDLSIKSPTPNPHPNSKNLTVGRKVHK